MAGLTEGLGFEEVNQAVTSTATLSGTNVFGAGSVTGGRVINAVGRLRSTGTGSPSTFGNAIQGGAGTTGAGSELWANFGTVFAAAPTSVVASAAGDAAVYLSVGSISAGSCIVTSHGAASTAFTWIAIGA